MLRLAVFALSALGALAQGSVDQASITEGPSASETASPTSSSGPTTHTIAVGAAGHRFTPDETFAEVGDILEFLFYPANHSVVRAEYLFPCVPYEMHGVGRIGFNSGFQPVRAITNDSPRWQVRVNDTDPIFFYCGADGSCYRNHMIAVVNPNDEQTLESHAEAAEGLTFQVLPGEPYPEESGHAPIGRPTPTQDGDDEETGETAAASTPDSAGDDSGLGGGAIAGIVVGSVAVLVIGAAIVYLCGRRGGMDRAHRRTTFTPQHPSVMSEAAYTLGTKSPGMDSRLSAARWSLKSPTSPYREQVSPAGVPSASGSPVPMAVHPHSSHGFPGMDTQHTRYSQQHQAGFVPVYGSSPPSWSPSPDPRISQTGSPPPPQVTASPPPQSPVELPSESGRSPGRGRYSWVGQESEANFRASR